MKDFDPNGFPLQPGVRLLEASAGTGKTFALAHLVLRLVGEESVPLRRLLVVTFTEAAAAELRDRIGRRLQQALAGLERPGSRVPDAVLEQWLLRWGATDRDRLRGQLLLALEDLDGADITTIHGFCRRTLQRQAMEAGQPPDLTLESDGPSLGRQVVHDYWQRNLLPLPPNLLAGLRRGGVTPESMLRNLDALEGDPSLRLDPLPPPLRLDHPLADTLPITLRERWHAFVTAWRSQGRALEQAFRDAAAQWRRNGASKTGLYSARPRNDRCGDLDAWIAAQPEEGNYAAIVEQRLLNDYFHPGSFCREARKHEGDGTDGDPSMPELPLLEAIASLVDGPAEEVMLHGCHWCRRERASQRSRSGSTSFSQLLESLDPGTRPKAAGPLLRAVAERYDAALIDEFQDTDPVQWRILRQAFGSGGHQLVMVGDPKQSIYRFRGGDLATYRMAREQAQGRFALSENRRSSPELIQALNALMDPGLPRSELAVPPVQAMANRAGPLPHPIQLLWLGHTRAAGEKPPSATEIERLLPARVASHCRQLLQSDLWLQEGTSRMRLDASHICLLVQNHRQADAMREALEALGIGTRLVSRGDVFSSGGAAALQRLLDALADPADGRRLRLLAASPLLGWSAARMQEADAEPWSQLAGLLERLASELPRKGLLAVLAELLGGTAMARLALRGRLLADLQQTAQLVQERLHADQLGPAAAADWMRRLRLDADREVPEAHQPHSDQVDAAVSVVTVHRSKGLEFPVVICPYLWQAPGRVQRNGSGGTLRWHPPGKEDPHLDLHRNRDWGAGHAARHQHRKAERAERERLAYVAVTRTCHLLVLTWGPAAGQQASPLLPWLLSAEPLCDDSHDPIGERSDHDWRERLEAEIGRRGLAIEVLDEQQPGTPCTPPPTPARPPDPLALGPVPERRLDSRWGRSSYTSWTHAAASHLPPEALEEGQDRDGLGEDADTPALAPGDGADGGSGGESPGKWPENGPLADFPRGAAAGDCLHRILERLEYGEAAASLPNRDVVVRELARSGLQRQPLPPLLESLDRVRTTPFGGPLGGARLDEVAASKRLNEMNFDLPLGFARAEGLATAFASHPGGAFGADYAERLARLPVASRGFLTGSIDLVFTAPDERGEPRWWIADWKSNWMGRRDPENQPLACGPAHYGQRSMRELMTAQHYPLQAHLYLVALHRYLRWRLPKYEPQRHLGGYAYVFLRGLPGEEGVRALPGRVPGMFVEQPPLERVLALDRVLGAEEGGTA